MSVRRLLAAALLALAVGAPAAHAAGSATATFTTKADWGGGFTGEYALHNATSAPISAWRLEFDLAPGQRLTSVWGALIARSDQHYVLTPVAYTRTLKPGATIALGFEGTEEQDPFVAPLNCRLNGLACDGSGLTSSAGAPGAPTGLVASERGATSVTLGWTAAAAAQRIASYDVLRDGRQVATVTTASATVAGLSPAHRYRFRVRAVDAAGTRSPASAPLTVTTAAAEPTLNGALSADFATVNDWGTGYVASIVIRNHAQRPVQGWRLTLDLPAGSTLDSAWNADLAGDGSHATLTPAYWTKAIPAGGSVYVGFTGTTVGPYFPGPSGCSINGVSCATEATTPIASAPASTAGATGRPVRHSGATAPSFAPYVDLSLDPAFALTDALAAGALRDATFGFVVADGATCQAAWGGATRLDDPAITGAINTLRAGGGTPIVAFGGAGSDLADTCPTAGALAAQIQSVIDQYGARDLDFVVRSPGAAAAIARRSQAIAQIQATGRATGRPVHVSLTLPVTADGLAAGARRVLSSARAHGVEVGTVNLLAMDYAHPSAPTSALVLASATAAHRQLARLVKGASWRTLGLTTMLGVNAAPGVVFTTTDAGRVAAFARARGLGRLSLWSANRDAPCAGVGDDQRCSGVDAPAWAFGRAYAGFR